MLLSQVGENDMLPRPHSAGNRLADLSRPQNHYDTLHWVLPS